MGTLLLCRGARVIVALCVRLFLLLASMRDRKPSVVVLSLDSFYRELTQEENAAIERGEGFNFDVPAAFDYELLVATLSRLRRGQAAEVPEYDFASNSRTGSETVHPARVIILE